MFGQPLDRFLTGVFLGLNVWTNELDAGAKDGVVRAAAVKHNTEAIRFFWWEMNAVVGSGRVISCWMSSNETVYHRAALTAQTSDQGGVVYAVGHCASEWWVGVLSERICDRAGQG